VLVLDTSRLLSVARLTRCGVPAVRAVKTSDPDLQWIIDPAQPDGTVLSVTSSSETITVWKGTVKLPKARGTVPTDPRCRVRGARRRSAGNLGAKVTYLDAIEI